MNTRLTTSTIAAIATPPGLGGVGIIRVSGPLAGPIAQGIMGNIPAPRQATLAAFHDGIGQAIDQGIAIYFPAPHSFTGEDVLELQGHGGRAVMESLLRRVHALGAKPAKPGEFTERAFLNDKMDLAQAEAVADLIHATTEHAARAAMRSLSGVFSTKISTLHETLVRLRVFVEAAIDFPDEDIEFIQSAQVAKQLGDVRLQMDALKKQCQRGRMLSRGMTAVIVGKPNAGKSSLLNALAGDEVAIVTDIPGTTRDLIQTNIAVDGIPLYLIDTAGLRDTVDVVEKIGVERAIGAMRTADLVLWVIDATQPDEAPVEMESIPSEKCLRIYNKVDCLPKQHRANDRLYLSAKTGEGMNDLYEAIKQCVHLEDMSEDICTARERHVVAIEQACTSLKRAESQLSQAAIELLAQELREAHDALGSVLGKMTSDDLLGEIFGSFCIGK